MDNVSITIPRLETTRIKHQENDGSDNTNLSSPQILYSTSINLPPSLNQRAKLNDMNQHKKENSNKS